MSTKAAPAWTRTRSSDVSTRARTERQDRFSARLSTVQKEILQEAADIEGRTLTDFVLTHAQEAAQRTIREHSILRLSERDSLALMQALLSPWEPSADLRADVRDMRHILGDDQDTWDG